jgi:hypothetical protein
MKIGIDLCGSLLDEIICEHAEDIVVPDLVVVRYEILELMRRREEPGDPDNIDALERRLNRLLDEFCAIARRAA